MSSFLLADFALLCASFAFFLTNPICLCILEAKVNPVQPHIMKGEPT